MFLNNSYHEKAHEDLSYFKKHLEGIMNEIGMSNSIFHPGDIERFCKNSGFLKIIRFKSLAEEYSLPISESLRKFFLLFDEFEFSQKINVF
jgi:amyloid beta precursor protein binding protein 1